MKTLNFGIEIELTGITRNTAAKTIAAYFGTGETNHEGGTYDTYTAKDSKGRTWKAMYDSSIRAEKKNGGRAGDPYRTEVVSPILTYDDIEDLQEVVRQLRHKHGNTHSCRSREIYTPDLEEHSKHNRKQGGYDLQDIENQPLKNEILQKDKRETSRGHQQKETDNNGAACKHLVLLTECRLGQKPTLQRKPISWIESSRNIY